MIDDEKTIVSTLPQNLWPGWNTVRKIGEGSYGAVYEIERTVADFKERAALKVLSLPHYSAEVEALRSEGYSEEDVTRHFLSCLSGIEREYAVMAQIRDCENIVKSDDLRKVQHNEDSGWDVYIKMELLKGLTPYLDDKFGSAVISDEEVIKIGQALCNALTACRKHNIIHRDIKPQNILVSEDGVYKLGDFGTAKTMNSSTGLTGGIGTKNYMSPEVAFSRKYDYRADIYSVGIVLYWLLNERRLPFLPLPPELPDYEQTSKALQRRLEGETLPAPLHGSSELKKIVLKACAYEQTDRFQNSEEMSAALEGLLRIPETNRPKKRSVIPAIIISAAVICAGLILALRPVLKKTEDSVGVIPEQLTQELQTSKPEPSEISAPEPTLEPTTAPTPEPTLAPTPEPTSQQMALVSEPTPLPEIVAVSAIKNTADVSTGSIVTFGSYEQNNDESDDAEEIEWIVLAKDKDKLLLLSRYALDCRQYNSSDKTVTWGTSSIRLWLNGVFYNSAFSSQEQSVIETVKVEPSDNPDYPTDSGKRTYENVFLLSISEAEEHISSDELFQCVATPYAEKNGVDVSSGMSEYCSWWLRSPGKDGSFAAFVRDGNYGNGFISAAGDSVVSNAYGVRPAVWVKIGSGDSKPKTEAAAAEPTTKPGFLIDLGDRYYYSGNYEYALKIYQQALESQSPDAYYVMGRVYLEGYALPADYDKAEEYFMKAYEGGNDDSLIALGDLYNWIDIGKRNYEKAFEYYSEMLSKHPDDIWALYHIADMYYNGDYVEKNVEKAFEYMEKSASFGNAEAFASLGYYCLDRGDFEAAREYFKKAANAGSEDGAAMYKALPQG